MAEDQRIEIDLLLDGDDLEGPSEPVVPKRKRRSEAEALLDSMGGAETAE